MSTGDLTLVFAAVLVLTIIAALTRALSPPGRRRDTFSVILVVLGLIAAFLFCFGLGSFVRRQQAQPPVSATIPWLPRAIVHPSAE